MTGPDGQTFIIIDHPQEGHDIVIIVQRLTDTHDHDVADPLTLISLIKILLHQHDLGHDFPAGQIPLLGNQTRCTEGAANVAANLGGDTD